MSPEGPSFGTGRPISERGMVTFGGGLEWIDIEFIYDQLKPLGFDGAGIQDLLKQLGVRMIRTPGDLILVDRFEAMLGLYMFSQFEPDDRGELVLPGHALYASAFETNRISTDPKDWRGVADRLIAARAVFHHDTSSEIRRLAMEAAERLASRVAQAVRHMTEESLPYEQAKRAAQKDAKLATAPPSLWEG